MARFALPFGMVAVIFAEKRAASTVDRILNRYRRIERWRHEVL